MVEGFTIERFPAGHVFFHAAERAEFAFRIVEGEVEVFAEAGAKSVRLERLGKADIFGEDALHGVAGGFYSTRAVALSEVRAIRVARAPFERELHALPPDMRGYIEFLFDFNFELAAMLAEG